MPLIDCVECGQRISDQASACPQCGHPNDANFEPISTPQCYCCSLTATTRCQSCGELSCAQHVQSIFVHHGKGGAYELRCEGCYASAKRWKTVGFVVAGIALVIFAIIFFGFWLPGWTDAQKKHKDFDKEWEKQQREHDEFKKKHGLDR